MDKEKIKSDLIVPNLKPGEELIGYFYAQYFPSRWWALLFGPLWAFGVKTYVVAVTNQGIHLHKLHVSGKPNASTFLPFAEITGLHLGKGIIQAPLQLKLTNGKKIKLKAQLKGVEGVAKLDDATREFLTAHIRQ